MTLAVTVQYVLDASDLPTETDFTRWAEAALTEHRLAADLVIRIVDEAEGRSLNHRYRGKDYATNVLSFSADLPPGVDLPVLGDLVICAPVVRREAAEQGKNEAAHWAHLVVHGCLHLLGYDHETEPEAKAMETLETAILARLGLPNPYI